MLHQLEASHLDSRYFTPSSRSVTDSRISGRGYIHYEPPRRPASTPTTPILQQALEQKRKQQELERGITFKPQVGRSPRYDDEITPYSLANRRAVEPPQFPFQPAISETSRRLARQRSGSPRWRQLFEEASYVKLDHFPRTNLAECTFVPDVSSSDEKIQAIKAQFKTIDKYFERRRWAKSPEPSTMRKAETNFPFKPKVNQAPHVLPVEPSPKVDEHCQRLAVARRREAENRAKKRRIPSSESRKGLVPPPLRLQRVRSNRVINTIWGPYPT
jgi:hypothetical protein